jgi:hypothetical protein
MRGFHFPPASSTSDWRAPFYIAVDQTNYVPDTKTHWEQGPPPGFVPNYPPTKIEEAKTSLVTWHPPDDEVILGMSPDAHSFEDYGQHHRSYPPGRQSIQPTFFQTSSNDGSGYITLINPGLIDIIIPASVMRGFGVGELNIGLRFARASDSRTTTIFTGKLPVIWGVV